MVGAIVDAWGCVDQAIYVIIHQATVGQAGVTYEPEWFETAWSGIRNVMRCLSVDVWIVPNVSDDKSFS